VTVLCRFPYLPQRTVSLAASGPEPTSCSLSLKGYIGHLTGRGIDLIERALGEGIDLHGVDVAVAGRLHARDFIGRGDPDRRIFRLRHGLPGRRHFRNGARPKRPGSTRRKRGGEMDPMNGDNWKG
jgi:hypothetical protein